MLIYNFNILKKIYLTFYFICSIMCENNSLEAYRSGHNGAHSKCVWGQPHVSSNLTASAKKARFYRWLYRFRAFFLLSWLCFS